MSVFKVLHFSAQTDVINNSSWWRSLTSASRSISAGAGNSGIGAFEALSYFTVVRAASTYFANKRKRSIMKNIEFHLVLTSWMSLSLRGLPSVVDLGEPYLRRGNLTPPGEPADALHFRNRSHQLPGSSAQNTRRELVAFLFLVRPVNNPTMAGLDMTSDWIPRRSVVPPAIAGVGTKPLLSVLQTFRR